jgi:hypothetical protein
MTEFEYLKETIENSFMSNDNLKFSAIGDGRLDSAESEPAVINHLIKLFQDTKVEIIPAPRARHWYDIQIKYNEHTYPVNIKITSGDSPDNVSSKLGLFYALTGLEPETITGLNTWQKYNEKITENFNPNSEADYYFIVYFKNEEMFLFTSLKRINILVPNGNNLPFQCKWSDNDIITTRSIEDQCDYLMEIYYTSWIKKVNGIEPLLKWKETRQ